VCRLRLAPVRVAGPFVEHEHAAEIAQVFHFAQLFVGKEVKVEDINSGKARDF
jgi:hypothetical protein